MTRAYWICPSCTVIVTLADPWKPATQAAVMSFSNSACACCRRSLLAEVVFVLVMRVNLADSQRDFSNVFCATLQNVFREKPPPSRSETRSG